MVITRSLSLQPMATDQADDVVVDDEDRVTTGPILQQRRGRQSSEARDEFTGSEMADWDQKTWVCNHCQNSWKWGKSGNGSRMEAHITGDCSKLRGVTIQKCRKVPQDVRNRIAGKRQDSAGSSSVTMTQRPQINIMLPHASSALSTEFQGGDNSALLPNSLQAGQSWGQMPLFQVASTSSPQLSALPQPTQQQSENAACCWHIK